jgi:cell division septation protein DedD
MDERAPEEREVTLNTGTVLALFFTLALICAVFFGFGYSMGKKSAAEAPVAAVAPASGPTDSGNDTGSASSDNDAASKSTAGSAAQPVPAYVPTPGGSKSKPAAGTSEATTSQAARETTATVKQSTPAAPVVRSAPQPTPQVVAPTSGPAAAGSTFVQIAAVSHAEDASVLVSALQRRGYHVLTRNEATDKLIHVQIGPFADRKAAEAMRQKLLGDGYNAFLK